MKSSSLRRYIPSQWQVLKTITSTIPSGPAGLTLERVVAVISITCFEHHVTLFSVHTVHLCFVWNISLFRRIRSTCFKGLQPHRVHLPRVALPSHDDWWWSTLSIGSSLLKKPPQVLRWGGVGVRLIFMVHFIHSWLHIRGDSSSWCGVVEQITHYNNTPFWLFNHDG